MVIENYIVINSDKRFGKPIIKGTRIAVSDVLNWLAHEMTFIEIINEFPELSKEAIKACLIFAANKEKQIAFAS